MAKRDKKRGWAGKASYFTPIGANSYTYSGPLYTLRPESRLTARQASTRRLLLGGGIMVLSLLCGFLPAPGMRNTFYVILPYAGGLILAAVSLWKAARIAYWNGNDLREYVYQATVERLPMTTLASVVFAGLSIVGEGFCLLLEGAERADLPFAIIFLLMQGVILTLALLWRKFETGLAWEKR